MRSLVFAAVFAALLIAKLDPTRLIVWSFMLAANIAAAQLAAEWRR